jgi:transcriptional regulator with XRE-family HTH domain
MEFKDYLKKLRKDNGLSIRQLALYSEVSHAYLSQIENGLRGNPSPDVLKKLYKPLKVPYEELMRAAGHIENSNDVNVAGKTVVLSPEELKIFNKIKQQPLLFHKLAEAPEKKIKALIRMWEALEAAEDEEDEDIIED